MRPPETGPGRPRSHPRPSHEGPSKPPPFEDALRRVADRLDLPQPERTRILEEIATDLEELRTGLVQRGVSTNDAERRAVHLLVPTEPAIDALIELHEPLHRKLTRRFSPSAMRRAERAILLLVTAGALGPMLAGLIRSGVLTDPSPLLWGIIALDAAILCVAGRKALQLLFARNHDAGSLRNGLGLLLAGSGVALGFGLGGLVLELYGLAADVEASGRATTLSIIPWLLDSSALLAASLITALLGGLCWFLLLQKVEKVERAHQRAAMLLGGTSSVTARSISGFDDSRTFKRQGAGT